MASGARSDAPAAAGAGNPGYTISVCTDEVARDRALAADVSAGLGSTPKDLPPKWFYDDEGSRLFGEITRLPEYYPTRREHEILRRVAPEIATLSGAGTLVELGSGFSGKTRLLLDAMAAAGTLEIEGTIEKDLVSARSSSSPSGRSW